MKEKNSISPEGLRKVRDALNETQAEFAARLSIKQSTLSRWENGRLPTGGAAQALLRRVLEDINRVLVRE